MDFMLLFKTPAVIIGISLILSFTFPSTPTMLSPRFWVIYLCILVAAGVSTFLVVRNNEGGDMLDGDHVFAYHHINSINKNLFQSYLIKLISWF